MCDKDWLIEDERERERESLIRRINNYKEVEDNHVVFIVCHMASYYYYYRSRPSMSPGGLAHGGDR